MGTVTDATGDIMNIGSSGGVSSLFTGIFVILLVGMGVWIAYKRLNYWAEAWIFETTGSGTLEIKKDYIARSKNKKTSEVTYKLVKAKVEIPEPQLSERYRFGRKYVCPLHRGGDGWTRPLNLVTDYVDDAGETQPYFHPVDNQLKKHLFHVMLTKTARYRVQSALERLAPYGVMGLCVVVVIVSLHLHNKGLGV